MCTNTPPEGESSGTDDHEYSTAELRQRERRDELSHAEANLLQARLLEEDSDE